MISTPVYNKYEKGIYKFNADIAPLLIKTLQCELKKFIAVISTSRMPALNGKSFVMLKQNIVGKIIQLRISLSVIVRVEGRRKIYNRQK